MAKKYKNIEEIIVEGSYIDKYSFDAPIIDILGRLSSILQTAYEQGYADVRLKIEYDYDNDGEYAVFGSRSETNKERTKRLEKNRKAREMKAKEKIEKQVDRRELYDELRKEFEPDE